MRASCNYLIRNMQVKMTIFLLPLLNAFAEIRIMAKMTR
jgi:hypothetical protein